MAESPTDRCPYLRPFPEDFRACPAYGPSRFVALDTGYRPLSFVWTCAHLDAAVAPQRNRFYAKCRIGDPAARAAWVAAQRVERLAALRAMSDEFNAAVADLVGRLWEAKGRQLRADEGSAERRAATAHLRELGDQFLTGVERFLEEHAAPLQALGFPLEPCLGLFSEVIERWVEQPNAEPPVISDSSLEPFPPDTRVFFKPDYVAESA